MSIEDRDWYREAYKEKEEKYGGDFSLHSKPKINSGNGNPPRRPTMTKNADPSSKGKGLSKTVLILITFYGSVGVLFLTSKITVAWPLVFVMLIYNIWMLITVFAKKPKSGIGIKILALFFFIFSEGVMGLLAYWMLQKFLL